MNPEQLWETTLNPEVRALKKVTIEDIVESDGIFTILMGTTLNPAVTSLRKTHSE